MSFRVNIDGDWDAADFAAFFLTLEEVYNYYVVTLHKEFGFEPGRVFAYLPRGMPSRYRYRLNVEKIQYGSPGFTDLAGIAAAVRELREFLQFIIARCIDRKARKLDEREKELSIKKLEIEVARELIEFRNEYGNNMPEGADRHSGIRREGLPDTSPLIKLVLDEKIVGVDKNFELLDENDEND